MIFIDIYNNNQVNIMLDTAILMDKPLESNRPDTLAHKGINGWILIDFAIHCDKKIVKVH